MSPLVRSTLDRGAGSFSLVAAAYALGSICAGAVLARRPVRRKARASMLAWLLYLPAYGLFAVAGSLGVALAAGLICGSRTGLVVGADQLGRAGGHPGPATWAA